MEEVHDLRVRLTDAAALRRSRRKQRDLEKMISDDIQGIREWLNVRGREILARLDLGSSVTEVNAFIAETDVDADELKVCWPSKVIPVIY